MPVILFIELYVYNKILKIMFYLCGMFLLKRVTFYLAIERILKIIENEKRNIINGLILFVFSSMSGRK